MGRYRAGWLLFPFNGIEPIIKCFYALLRGVRFNPLEMEALQDCKLLACLIEQIHPVYKIFILRVFPPRIDPRHCIGRLDWRKEAKHGGKVGICACIRSKEGSVYPHLQASIQKSRV